MTTPDIIQRDVAILDLVREHLVGKHNSPEEFRSECLACDHYRLGYELEQVRERLEGWERIGERITHHIPEHYQASYTPHEDWARDAAEVVAKAHAWRKCGRTDEDGDELDVAVETIYPSEVYV